MKYFEFAISKEIIYIRLINFVCRLIDMFKFTQNKIIKQCRSVAIKSKNKDNIAVIILNAPSVKHQDLTLLAKYDMVFVNRGFLHPDYEKLSPKYHIICDPKFENGIWPITWIDEILRMVPGITFVFPIEWRNISKFKKLQDDGLRILWIKLKDKAFSPFVVGFTIQFLMGLDYETIYFTGCEANGLGYELVKDTSHFYGKNSENNLKTSDNYIEDFYMYFCNYSYLKRIAKYARKKGVKIVNLTLGGCLDMFERGNLSNL